MTSSIQRALTALLFTLAAAVPALAQAEKVNVYQYAVDHPVADAPLRGPPTLGASVPQNVEIIRVGNDEVYGYFYYDGRPVIVELATRSVVRIDS
ncbi:DUF1236 domain-containing protein [Aureimonas jatrophae]|jgi:hypothetical protein|uniref:DUF1236 domain-containing protein n=1 Tax=Aureimonas jatrophae TaxID=1166073 RepID=A0A1H0IMQ3_9HYPH|nr:DUF1236 domain-containing protein [Aureimonas jatrophae]MBB3952245.1 hypothetical protein [Aureimonas jatrophae]SDO32321.1 Protein of unknown function [Aureimonas jatrophae]